MSDQHKAPKIGDIEPCDDYAAFRRQLIDTYSHLISRAHPGEISESDYVFMYGDAQSLAYRYSLVTCCREIKIPPNVTVAELMRFFWKLTPPYYECTGFYHNGDPRWRGMHSTNLKEYFYD